MSAGDRIELAGSRALLGIAFAFGCLLAAVLPTRGEFARAVDRPPGAQSIQYLQVLARASPGDDELRRLYVRHLTELGRFDVALAALGGTGSTPDPATENLRFDLLLARARATPDGTSARTQAFAAVERELVVLRALPQTADRMRYLASVALEVNNPALAADYFIGVASLARGAERAAAMGSAGRWLRAAGEDARASGWYREAAASEPDPRASRAYAGLAIDTLVAAADPAGAADLAASYADRFGDVASTQRAADLAAAAGRPIAARDLGRRLLAAGADDDARLEAQARRELAAGDVRAALPLVGRILERHVGDERWHRVDARVAEWAGDPERALADWLWLVDHGAGASDPSAGAALP